MKAFGSDMEFGSHQNMERNYKRKRLKKWKLETKLKRPREVGLAVVLKEQAKEQIIKKEVAVGGGCELGRKGKEIEES